jgi:hypothetical protein
MREWLRLPVRARSGPRSSLASVSSRLRVRWLVAQWFGDFLSPSLRGRDGFFSVHERPSSEALPSQPHRRSDLSR